ncbi:MAG TPA: hypothetical protein VFJ49_06650 [Methyloceanibacter sp.]|nr:hypothetical protein [Methyloceanibacter sp.]
MSLLSACAGISPLGPGAEVTSSGAWQISKSTDSVTGEATGNIKLTANQTSHDGRTFPGGTGLQLVCFKGQPVVHFIFIFQIGSKSDSEISYRFDDKPAHTIKPHILRGLEMMVIEDRSEVAQFMNGLATANTLYLTINSLAKGGSTASFNVAGASPAIELVHKACHG